MFCIYALQDNGNLGAGNLTPLGLFFVIFGIGACFGWETGYAINLARDFGMYTLLTCRLSEANDHRPKIDVVLLGLRT